MFVIWRIKGNVVYAVCRVYHKVHFSPQRLKYENRVTSYKTDKKLLDTELERAVNRLRKSEDRSELFETDETDHMVGPSFELHNDLLIFRIRLSSVIPRHWSALLEKCVMLTKR